MVTLWQAAFQTPLLVRNLSNLPAEVRSVLAQLGVDEGEVIEKSHQAPLGDPVALRIGSHHFSLRKEVCRHILVEVL